MSLYLKYSLQDRDWRFAAIMFLSICSSFLFGNYLYGLPFPQPPQRQDQKVEFTFSRIVVPSESVSTPTVFESAGGTKQQSVRTSKKQRDPSEIISSRVGSLLNRIDSSLKLDGTIQKNTGKQQRSATNSATTNIQRPDIGDLKSRSLYNYERKQTNSKKSIASIETATPTAPLMKNRRLDRGSANTVMRRAQGSFRNCYEQALKIDTSLRGKIYVSFNINPDGSTGDVGLKADDHIRSDNLLLCLRRTITQLTFPPTKKQNVPVSFPLDFTPSRR